MRRHGQSVAKWAFAALCLIVANSPAKAQDAQPPEVWKGTAFQRLVPQTLQLHPGQHVKGDVLAEGQFVHSRTARLSADIVAAFDNHELRLPAGTPLYGTFFGPPIQVAVDGRASPPPPAHAPAPDTIYWCALPEHGGFVCFFWQAPGQVFFQPYYSGRISYLRAPWGILFPGPEPEISEQTVQFPRMSQQAVLTDWDETGAKIRRVFQEEGNADESYGFDNCAWDTDCQVYGLEVVLRLQPVRDNAGTISGATVSARPREGNDR